jgi:hypothetical protein
VNFAFYEELTADEGREYLDRFLEVGGEKLPDLVAAAEADGVTADLSLDSVERVVAWVARQAVTVPLSPDPELPDWIRASKTYEANLFDFDEASKVLVLRLAFYLRESFARTCSKLAWSVGRKDTAPQGQPVITGFIHRMEMPVLLVAENLVVRATSDDAPARRRAGRRRVDVEGPCLT